MAPQPGSHQVPYISVVVTSRNDDHGGDPLKRLQAFVNCFDAQCRRAGLDAEIIIVEWNPPGDKPRLKSLMRWPTPCVCTYRFITVPPELHDTLQYADVLPLFQMIAKNVGIRRARGRFVLATNIDIIFSNELVDFLASGQLEPGWLYRVDRHDIQPAFPVDAALDDQMAYCAEHHLRIHARSGSYAVDGLGRALPMAEDIVDGKTVRLGSGWHVREGNAATGFCRWATELAVVHIDRSGDPALTPAVLELETQANPYMPASWVDLEIADASGAVLARHRVTRRRIWRLPLREDASSQTLALRVAGIPPENRRHLAVFERRDAMHYQVRSIRVTSAGDAGQQPSYVYPAFRWRALADASLEFGALDTVSVTTSPDRNSYAAEYGPMSVPQTGPCRLTLTYDLAEGDIAIGLMDATSRQWLPAVVDDILTPRGHVATASLELAAGARVLLVVSNDPVGADRASRFTIKEITGSIDPKRMFKSTRLGQSVSPVAPASLAPAAELIRQSPADERHQKGLEAWSNRRKRQLEAAAMDSLRFSLDGWRSANPADPPTLEHVADGLGVVSRGGRWRYCIEYGPIRAPVAGTYHFALDYRLLEGGVVAGLLSEDKRRWLRSRSSENADDDHRTLVVSAALKPGQSCWLTLSNDHAEGGITRLLMTDLRGVVEPRDLLAAAIDSAAAVVRGERTSWLGYDLLPAGDGAVFSAETWRIANLRNASRIEPTAGGLVVETAFNRGSYALEAGPFRATATGSYKLTLTCDVNGGGVALGALNRRKTQWLPYHSDGPAHRGRRTLTTTLQLAKGQIFWLIVSNAHPRGDSPSQFVIGDLRGSIQPAGQFPRVARSAQDVTHAIASRMTWLRRRLVGLALRMASRAMPDRARRFVDRVRASIVYRSPEYGALLTVRQSLERDVARLNELSELAQLHKLLKDYRPDPLHLNACGDFQLMAREHWAELRGYPEFQTFSMNIDGLFSSIARYAAITERVLESPCRIYHLEHEVGSGWTPEGEAVLRRRIAERGITWLDSRDVFVWSAYMHWLKRPMIFNESTWGFGSVDLEESVVAPRFDHA